MYSAFFMACITTPATESPAPATTAVNACGKRMPRTIAFTRCSEDKPSRLWKTSETGTLAEPNPRERSMARASASAVSVMTVLFQLR